MKKIFMYIIITLVLILEINFLLSNICYAKIDTSTVTIDQGSKKALETQGNKILGVIKVVVIFIAVGGAMILGIKYMMGSVDEKSKYKEALILYLIGILLAFGITRIVELVSKVVS